MEKLTHTDAKKKTKKQTRLKVRFPHRVTYSVYFLFHFTDHLLSSCKNLPGKASTLVSLPENKMHFHS